MWIKLFIEAKKFSVIFKKEELPLAVIEWINEISSFILSILIISVRLGLIELLRRVTVPFFFEACSVYLRIPVTDDNLKIAPRLFIGTNSTAILISHWWFFSFHYFLSFGLKRSPRQCKRTQLFFTMSNSSDCFLGYLKLIRNLFHTALFYFSTWWYFKQFVIDIISFSFVRFFFGETVDMVWFFYPQISRLPHRAWYLK